MSHFPITHYRFLSDPFDRVFGDQLHLFDPWRDFDTFQSSFTTKPNSFRWINEPARVTRSSSSYHSSSSSSASAGNNNNNTNNTLIPVNTNSPPALSEKFRVQMNVDGFSPESIKTRIDGRKIVVEAKQEDRHSGGDYSIREIRKSYELPEHADTTNLASFVTPNNMLVIELPVFHPRTERRPSQAMADASALAQFGQYRDPIFDYSGFVGSSEFRPRILDTHQGSKQLKMSLSMKNYRPEQIKVSVKNNELLVQAEHIYNDNNRSERSFLTKSITLPPGTHVEQLKSFLSPEGQLEIEAPFTEPTFNRPIEVQRQ